jgi:feruloyl esterase
MAAVAMLAVLASSMPASRATAAVPSNPFDHPGSFANANQSVVHYAQATIAPAPNSACNAALAVVASTASFPVSQTVHVPATSQTPGFCDIQGTINGIEGFEIALPDAWNGRLYVWGNGGWAGEPMAQFEGNVVSAVQRGFVYAHTNTGHWETGAAGPGTASFASNQQELIDWAYQAVHDVTVYAKAVSKQYYGLAPKRSYFEGCSTGGRQAMTAVQRYPNDFDGVIAGSPANQATNLYIEGVWEAQRYYTGPFTLAQASAAAASAIKRCGEVDAGIPMGLIADPRSCQYLSGVDGIGMTAAQNAAFEGIMEGATNKYGRLGWGPSIGSSLTGYYLTIPPTPVDEGAYTAVSVEDYASGFLQYLAPYEEPNASFTMTGFNFNTDPYRMNPIRSVLDESWNPNLSTYAKRGGKVIIYHGWADPLIPTDTTVAYVEDVYHTMGYSNANAMMRAFFVPGMGHCGNALGGYGGPDTFDMVTPLIDWVEAGQAPTAVVASGVPREQVGEPFSTPPPVPYLTRPLCAYPYAAKYVSGNPFQATSFTCAPGITGIPNPVANSPGSLLPSAEFSRRAYVRGRSL